MNLDEIVIEKVVAIEPRKDSIKKDSIKIVVKCTNQKIYDLNFEIGDLALASFTFDNNQIFINIPIGKIYAQINKEYVEKYVANNIVEYVFQHQNDDFYIIMSFDTLKCVEKEMSSLLQTTSDSVLFRGHKIIIDNCLKFGEVVFR